MVHSGTFPIHVAVYKPFLQLHDSPVMVQLEGDGALLEQILRSLQESIKISKRDLTDLGSTTLKEQLKLWYDLLIWPLYKDSLLDRLVNACSGIFASVPLIYYSYGKTKGAILVPRPQSVHNDVSPASPCLPQTLFCSSEAAFINWRCGDWQLSDCANTAT